MCRGNFLVFSTVPCYFFSDILSACVVCVSSGWEDIPGSSEWPRGWLSTPRAVPTRWNTRGNRSQDFSLRHCPQWRNSDTPFLLAFGVIFSASFVLIWGTCSEASQSSRPWMATCSGIFPNSQRILPRMVGRSCWDKWTLRGRIGPLYLGIHEQRPCWKHCSRGANVCMQMQATTCNSDEIPLTTRKLSSVTLTTELKIAQVGWTMLK